ncbi:MAG: SH3 domain-containing protein, partial [Clostridia bacterium]|nr:SH3 domain-containing protein [Clostridia bacterium]
MNIRRNAQRSLTVLLAIALLLLPLPSAVAETFSAFVKSSSMKVYSNAKKTSKLATLSQYTVVSVLEYSGSTARISWSGKTGYASVSDMERVSAVAKVATIKSATRVYKSASTSSESVQVSAGMQVNVIHVENGWAIVERNGVGGYIAYDQLNMGSSPTTSATVTSSSMKVYASASTSSAKLGTLKKGAQVNVVSVSGSWAYVERNGSYGYCKVSSLKLSQAVPASTPTPTPAPTSAPISVTTMKVTSSSVTIYTKASTSSSKLGTLKKGKLINVISTSGKWAYVEFNGKNGYCKLSSLGKYDPLEGYKKETFTATVVRNGAKIYETASSSASSKALNLGADVAVSAYNDTWAYVQIDGVKGFVQIAQLSRAQFATLSKGSTGSNVSVLEKALLIMGYLDGTPDTTFDSATMAAVQRFQQALSRTASGEADASLQRVLYSGNGPVSP